MSSHNSQTTYVKTPRTRLDFYGLNNNKSHVGAISKINILCNKFITKYHSARPSVWRFSSRNRSVFSSIADAKSTIWRQSWRGAVCDDWRWKVVGCSLVICCPLRRYVYHCVFYCDDVDTLWNKFSATPPWPTTMYWHRKESLWPSRLTLQVSQVELRWYDVISAHFWANVLWGVCPHA